MKIRSIYCLLFITLFSMDLFSQTEGSGLSKDTYSKVEITGDANLIFESKGSELQGKIGHFSNGEKIRVKEFEGSVYMNIYPEDRKISENIGIGVALIKIYEYDFGNDESKEILVINQYGAHTLCYVYTYIDGSLERIFENDMRFYKTIVAPKYIEHNVDSPANTKWNYSDGGFTKE